MTEENNLTSESGKLPPASQKTKEQWLDEGHHLAFYAPIRKEEGLAAYEQVIRLDDDEPLYSYLAYMNSTTILATLSRYEEALATYLEGSRLEPNNAGIWRSIGDALTALERPQEAQQAYEKARQLDSGGEA